MRIQKIPGVKACGNFDLFVESSTFTVAPCLTKAKSNQIEVALDKGDHAQEQRVLLPLVERRRLHANTAQ